MEEEIQRAKEILIKAQGVTVLTGAGISAESGIPTFRGDDGLWKKYRPEDVDTEDAFRRNPKYVWEWYNDFRKLISKTSPNPGHYALAALEKIKSNLTVITQNIDDHHRAAGNTNIIELHGNIWWARCMECNHIEENRDVPLKEIPLKCKACSALLRPGVIWFGDNIPI
jgi:NAD-dependent deacetylase